MSIETEEKCYEKIHIMNFEKIHIMKKIHDGQERL